MTLALVQCINVIPWQMQCFLFLYSDGSRGGRPPPTAQNFLNFMQFFGNFGKIICWSPLPGGLAPPPTGNPVSAPAIYLQCSLLFRSWDVSKYGIRCQLAKGIIFYLRFFTTLQFHSRAVRAAVSQSMSMNCMILYIAVVCVCNSIMCDTHWYGIFTAL